MKILNYQYRIIKLLNILEQLINKPVCKEAHHDGGHNEEASHQHTKDEEGGAGGVLNHLFPLNVQF